LQALLQRKAAEEAVVAEVPGEATLEAMETRKPAIAVAPIMRMGSARTAVSMRAGTAQTGT
jgi:hypothetical protein